MMMIRAGSGWVRAYRQDTGSSVDLVPETLFTGCTIGRHYLLRVSSPSWEAFTTYAVNERASALSIWPRSARS